MKQLAMIACVGEDGGLGRNGELLWHIPADMKFFRETTTGHPVVMGGKTFRSIGKVLPHRTNVVLTRGKIEMPGVVTIQNVDTLRQWIAQQNDTVFVIGGASLYAEFLEVADILYLTEVASKKPADVYFPEFAKDEYIQKLLNEGEIEGVKYKMVEYRRRR